MNSWRNSNINVPKPDRRTTTTTHNKQYQQQQQQHQQQQQYKVDDENLIKKSDWKFLMNVETSNIIRDNDIKTLQKVIEILGYNHFDAYALDGKFRYLDQDMFKILNLSQLSIEYLLSMNRDYELEQKRYHSRLNSLEQQLQTLNIKYQRQSDELALLNRERLMELSLKIERSINNNNNNNNNNGNINRSSYGVTNSNFQTENKSIDDQLYTGRLIRNSNMNNINNSSNVFSSKRGVGGVGGGGSHIHHFENQYQDRQSISNIRDLIKDEIDIQFNRDMISETVQMELHQFREDLMKMDEQKFKIMEKDKKRIVQLNKRIDSFLQRVERMEDILENLTNLEVDDENQHLQQQQQLPQTPNNQVHTPNQNSQIFQQHLQQQQQQQLYNLQQQQQQQQQQHLQNLNNNNSSPTNSSSNAQSDSDVLQPRQPIYVGMLNRPYRLPCFIRHSNESIMAEREILENSLMEKISQKGIIEEDGLSKKDLNHFLTQLEKERKFDENYQEQIDMRQQLEIFMDGIIVGQLYKYLDPSQEQQQQIEQQQQFQSSSNTTLSNTSSNRLDSYSTPSNSSSSLLNQVVKTPNIDIFHPPISTIQQLQPSTPSLLKESTDSKKQSNTTTTTTTTTSTTLTNDRIDLASFEVSSTEDDTMTESSTLQKTNTSKNSMSLNRNFDDEDEVDDVDDDDYDE
ncbi:hypothetical protein DLAC_09089 [Tieghemostelium lacteum]|uniref:Cilium assembly protein DZIP1 N-terminal domain-containing protein n=1 Tax=Tieghemostelium lacteum TaxID=361077 RepID=A0A151Z958_TIELA|nr:hypothetical protein DLAC_09089 [Tieghemostelium lacteum]|eukprot:KYQ90466.1 hypothetical protein DLAC_09089 [Tieghemostelium lacteum]